MRRSSFLMVAGIAAVALTTYLVLEFSVPQRPPQLAPVVPAEPPMVVEDESAPKPEAE